MHWLKDLPLKKLTSFKVGGRADFFFEPRDIKDLKAAVILAKNSKIPVRIIGKGTNLLVDDRGVGGLVLRLSSPSFKKISFGKNYLIAGAGTALNRLIEAAKLKNLSGIEFLSGIPGTVGGAVSMNAGAWSKSIGDLVEEMEVMDYNGRIRRLTRNELRFKYRGSNLAQFIVLNVRLRLEKAEKKSIDNKIKLYLKNRFICQDRSFPNAGCIFKNPNAKTPAGRLIDECGLKGKRIGGAQVSLKHANFILNREKATSRDILNLMKLIQDKVNKKFKVKLQPEIKIWR